VDKRTRGRPKLPEDEKLVHVSVRLPQWMIDACVKESSVSTVTRKALAEYLRT
jgi:hypothetical protein